MRPNRARFCFSYTETVAAPAHSPARPPNNCPRVAGRGSGPAPDPQVEKFLGGRALASVGPSASRGAPAWKNRTGSLPSSSTLWIAASARRSRHSARPLPAIQPVAIGQEMVGLVLVDGLENAVDRRVGADHGGCPAGLSTWRSPRCSVSTITRHNFEQRRIGHHRGGVEFVDGAAESEADEAVDMAEPAIDRDRHPALPSNQRLNST